MWACHRAWSRQCANNKEVTQRVTESLPSIIQIKLEQKLQACEIHNNYRHVHEQIGLCREVTLTVK